MPLAMPEGAFLGLAGQQVRPTAGWQVVINRPVFSEDGSDEERVSEHVLTVGSQEQNTCVATSDCLRVCFLSHVPHQFYVRATMVCAPKLVREARRFGPAAAGRDSCGLGRNTGSNPGGGLFTG
jgi:hypothetical protein